MGGIYLHKGNWDRALAASERAMIYASKFPRSHVVRGQALVGMREYGRVIQDLAEAIRLDSKSAPAFMGRGEAHEKQGDPRRPSPTTGAHAERARAADAALARLGGRAASRRARLNQQPLTLPHPPERVLAIVPTLA